MADIKVSCAHCGQHISLDELWSGHQIQCPACQNSFIVTQAQFPAAAPAPGPGSPAPQPAAPSLSKLSAGATQVARATPPNTILPKQHAARPLKTGNPLLKYVMIAAVLAVIGGAAYLYLPALITQVQGMTNSKPTEASTAPAGGGSGPMGEVNGAMDVSDALDGGGSSSKPRAAAKPQPVVAQSPAAATNAAAKSANGALRSRHGQPGQAGQDGGGHR